MQYIDPETNEKFIPYIIESTYGLDRTVLAVICESYEKEIISEEDEREVLKIHPYLAAYKVAVLPLIKKKHQDKAKMLVQKLNKHFMVTYDESGTIGKRYRRQDAIGTPFCITVDDNTMTDDTVTIRNRDTMEQETITIDDLISYIEKRIKF